MSLLSKLPAWRGLRRLVGAGRAAAAADPVRASKTAPGLLDLGELAALVEVGVEPLGPSSPRTYAGQRALTRDDPWFHSHYRTAAAIVADALLDRLAADARIIDLGCGDGIMALGVCDASGRQVVGSDLTAAYKTLPKRAAEMLGSAALPERLSFVQGELNQPLPFADASFDAAYSWSVFEHVDSIAYLLGELRRVLKPGARFFLQIEPLYYSPFGSHLRRLTTQPWAHLLQDEASYLAQAAAASDQVRPEEQDMLYRLNEFENVKRYLISEYHSLNRVRSHELVSQALQSGFAIERCQINQVQAAMVPAELLRTHSGHDLRTNEIRLMLVKP